MEKNSFFQRKIKKIEKKSNFHLHFEKVVVHYALSKLISGRSSVVEHHVANVIVEGSTPFTRSIFCLFFNISFPVFLFSILQVHRYPINFQKTGIFSMFEWKNFDF